MEYTVAQVAADPDSVADALATVAPTWLARTGMAQSQGWTSVRMDRRPAVRAAPLLARRLGRTVLVWTVDAQRCGVSLFRANRDVIEAAADRADQVHELAKVFTSDHVPASGAGGCDEAVLAAAATDPARSPSDRHKAIAELLGVPHVVPADSWRRTATTRSPTNIRPSPADAEYRRHQRIRTARSWLQVAAGLGLIAILMLLIRGPWIGIPIVVAVILMLQLIRYLLGRSLPRYTRGVN